MHLEFKGLFNYYHMDFYKISVLKGQSFVTLKLYCVTHPQLFPLFYSSHFPFLKNSWLAFQLLCIILTLVHIFVNETYPEREWS